MLADIRLAPGIAPLDPLTIERLRRRAGELGADLVIVGPSDDPAELGCSYLRRGRPFVRIRRITGYLVGDLGRWNRAKRAAAERAAAHRWVLSDRERALVAMLDRSDPATVAG